jgi:hypothetical protein
MKKLSFLPVVAIILVAFFSSCRKQDHIANNPTKGNRFVSKELAEKIAKRTTLDMLFERGTYAAAYNKTTLDSNESDTTDLPDRQISSCYVVKDKDSLPALYFFTYTNDSGYIVVSADTRYNPICAYIPEGTLRNDTVNGGLIMWLETTIENIELLRDGLCGNDSNASYMWTRLLKQTNLLSYAQEEDIDFGQEDIVITLPCGGSRAVQFGPYLQTQWGQNYPYNAGCPTSGSTCVGSPNNGRYPTGCEATAIAQIIKYWHNNNQFSYQYSLMPTGKVTTYNYEVARLMYHAGQSCYTTYGCPNSSAPGSAMPASFTGAFEYTTAYYTSYNSSNNTLLIAQNLRSGLPVILDGCTSRSTYRLPVISNLFAVEWVTYDECHAWVCDGLQGKVNNCNAYTVEWLHMNWGQDGDNDGWYLYNDFRYCQTPIFTSWGWSNYNPSTNFNYANDICYNIHP